MLNLYARAATVVALLSAALIGLASSLRLPSGHVLLYMSHYDPTGSDWSVMDTASRLSYPLLKGALWPVWSPDGTRLALMFDIDQRMVPHVFAFETGQVQGYNTDISSIARPALWSPDGTRLLLIDYGYPVAPLFMLHLDDGTLENLDILSGEDYGWTPDGESVYFTQQGDTLLLDLDTREVTPLLPGVDAQWSPDGRWIAFERVNLAQAISWVAIMDTATGTSRIVPIPAENVLLHSWSPDGRWLISTRIDELPGGGVQQSLYLVDPVTLDGRDLSDVNIYCAVDWTPDGRLTFTDRQGWFWALDVDSGERALLLIRRETCAVAAWRPRKE
jgi:Tol biopolymer transport system component